MLELLELERVIADEESYIFQLKVPKFLFPFYKDFFRSVDGFASTMRYKARLAEEMADHNRAKLERERRKGHDAIKAKMREMYRAKLQETHSHVEAMKAVTASHKLYGWLRKQLKEEIQAQWELAIPKMLVEGKTSFHIAASLGLNPGTIRKLMSNYKTQLKSSDKIG